MKSKLLLCGAVLLAAGCTSPQNPFASSGEYSYAYDLVPQPVPDITPVEMERIHKIPAAGSAVSSNGALNQAGGGQEYSGR